MSKHTQQEVIELLVIQAKEGDVAALEKLYAHFFKPMRRYAALRVNDVMVAEDLVQNVWLKVGKRLRQLNNHALFQSWLYRALNWEVLDALKKTKPDYDTDIDSIAETQGTDWDAVLPMFNTLDSGEKDVAELHYLNGLSLAETALALGIPMGTAKSRLFRVRNKLRNWMVEEH